MHDMRAQDASRSGGPSPERLVHADARIAQLARQPGSLLTRVVLLEAGFGRGAIAHRLRTGRLRREHRGVYTADAGPLEPAGQALAAVLACGHGAVVADGWSTWLWGLEAGPVGAPQVVRTGANREGPAGIRLRRTAWLPDHQVTEHRGVPVTTPARTLLDLAATGSPSRLERALGEALASRLITPAALRGLVATSRPGTVQLRRALQDSPGITRSEAERRLARLLRRAELPRPRLNVRVAGLEVDAYWPSSRLVLELDGFAAHRGVTAFERDRRRDQELAAHGVTVLRTTWAQLTERPEALCVRLGAVLARAQPDPRALDARTAAEAC